MGMLEKYLPEYKQGHSRLIDSIDSSWSVFKGDKRDMGFNGLMSTDPTAIAYYLLMEGDIANNGSIPLVVRLALFRGLTNMIATRQNRITRGGKFGLFANISKGRVIRTSDCKLDIKIGLYRVTTDLVRFDLFIFRQSKRMQDTLLTDARYQLAKTFVYDHNGELIRITEV
jgi:hypothetical protein